MLAPPRCCVLVMVASVAMPLVARAAPLPEIRSQSAAARPSSVAAGAAAAPVTVLVQVDEAGRVVEASVSDTAADPALRRAVEQAARTVTFTTVRRGEQTVGFSAMVVYAFDEHGLALARLQTVFFPEELSVREQPASARTGGPIAFAVAAEEARRTPGTQGDAAKVVESLPGVGRVALGSGDLVLWGSAPAESRVLVDGIEIPALFHLGGLRSVIASPLVRAVQVVPGAHDATLGRGLGGLVQVATAEFPAGVHGGASLDPLDATVHLSVGAGTRWRMAGAWREGLVHRVVGSRLAHEARELVAVPRMRDQQLKATAIVSDVEEVQVLILASSDRLERSVGDLDPALGKAETQRQGFWRAGLRYRRLPEGGRSAEALVWSGGESTLRDLRFGATPAIADMTTRSIGARCFYREDLGNVVSLTAGLDGLLSRSRLAREGSLTVPGREGDPMVFGQPPGVDVNADAWRVMAIDVAPLLSADLALGPLAVTAGGRLEVLGLEVSRRTPRVGETPSVGAARLAWELDPRLSARLSLNRWLALTAALGRYHQLPPAEDRSAVFGTPELGAARAEHAVVGGSVRMGEFVTAEAAAYAKRLDHLPARDRTATPALARSLTSSGRGRSAGIQFSLRVASPAAISGWLAYTLSRSQRQDAPGEQPRFADFDERHVLAVVAAHQRGPWNLSVRFRYSSGVPRTPVVGAYYDVSAGRFSPLFGPVNSTRLSPFMQLDARGERSFPLGPAALDVYLELLNLTARRNAEELVYNFDYSGHEAMTGLRFFAVAGARLRF